MRRSGQYTTQSDVARWRRYGDTAARDGRVGEDEWGGVGGGVVVCGGGGGEQ